MLVDSTGEARPAGHQEVGGARLALVFNGEIYNYIELRDELRSLGYSFHSSGDSEVLLRAYEAWGVECLPRLNGMFAFGVWDAAARTLFCARDRFGEKPFHYVLDRRRGVVAFGSEVKALVAAGVASGELEERAIYRYFRFGEQEGVEQTIWSGVERLLPAHYLAIRFDRGSWTVDKQAYWTLNPNRTSRIAFDDAAEQFGALFRDSVRLRLRSDVPIGTSLSGGLDSASVLCSVRALGAGKGQQAFSARMDDPVLDEGPHIDALLREVGIPGHSVVPTANELLEELDNLFFHQEAPFPTTSLFASYLVQRLAREHGVAVMLDGQGADEYLAGYAHYPALVLSDLARRGQLFRWSAERRALMLRSAVDPVPPRAFVYHVAHHLGRGVGSLPIDTCHENQCLSADLRERYRDERVRELPVQGNVLKTRLYADLMLGHLQELLRYADRNSMAFSRELRLPFLDHRLVEFVMELPTQHLLFRGESKRVLRQAMRGVVPDVILDRRDKVGFVVPWKAWWLGETRGNLQDELKRAETELRGLVVPGVASPGSREALSIIGLASASASIRRLATSPACR